ncbi:MAG: Fe(2+) transporter permease subunit FeoB [Candidatus Arsenophonus melophagi]|nr:Fe(2+) transporter permease subunit FeoB [Candidatus Arsenophonus melophagi]
MKSLTIGLIGNPNSGKTTLFNQLTGSHQRVGNWPGVTVERKVGYFSTSKYDIELVDLPGTYSLTTVTEQTVLDEQITCQFILNGEADMLINVIDATHLERNLYLTMQLIEFGIPCFVALNMLDIIKSHNIHININELQSRLGCPVTPLVSTRAQGISQLKKTIDQHSNNLISTIIYYPDIVLTEVEKLTQSINDKKFSYQKRRWLALQILEGDIYSLEHSASSLEEVDKIKEYLKSQLTEEPELIIADARYQTISNICKKVINTETAKVDTLTKFIDNIVLNRWIGLPTFLFIMYLMFILSINIGGALQPFFEGGSEAIFIHGIQWVGYTFNLPQWLTVFLAQGFGGGINTALPLVPQIGLMYLFLSILEDSGYMARAAFVMDRMMQALGLPGKSFVPLIVGFGCNVPAIMGARTLDSPRARLITILMAPFMSCGARLAIFAVFSAAFFGKNGANIVFSLYLLGIVVAIFTGLLLKHTIARGASPPFVMELPVYHIPHLKTLLLQTWQRLKGFVLRAGKVIIIASMIIGALSSFSLSGKVVDNINQSALASVSKNLTPILKPIGTNDDNWQATVGLITGALAKEVVVGTLNTLYTAENINRVPFDAEQFNLFNELEDAINETVDSMKETFSFSVLSNPIGASKGDADMDNSTMGTMSVRFGSILSAYSYLIFVLLYVPCISVLGAIARETNRSWMMFSILWGLNVAYSFSAIFYQIATFLEHPQYSSIIIGLLGAFNLLIITLLRYSYKYITLKLNHNLHTYNHHKHDSCH